jgi:hypothetical protein
MSTDTQRYAMPDDQRSAHGLGYEYHRRGQTIEHNPHPTESWRWRWFREGWLARREQELAKQVRTANGI